MSDQVEVKVGQVWEDTDKRSKGRRIKVFEVKDGYAFCQGVSGRDPSVNNGFVAKAAKKVRIRLDRFRPGSTGYKLSEDVQATS